MLESREESSQRRWCRGVTRCGFKGFICPGLLHTATWSTHSIAQFKGEGSLLLLQTVHATRHIRLEVNHGGKPEVEKQKGPHECFYINPRTIVTHIRTVLGADQLNRGWMTEDFYHSIGGIQGTRSLYFRTLIGCRSDLKSCHLSLTP